MITINCTIMERIQKDFSSLWKCKSLGNTVEITTPYLLPDSTLLSLFITKRNDQYIIHDGGCISQIVAEYCPFPDSEIKASLDGFCAKHNIKQARDASKQTYFFKDCEKPSLISSAAFDLAAFATSVTNVLVAVSYEEPGIQPDERFERSADAFIRSSLPTGYTFKPRQEIKEVPGVKFSGIIFQPSRIWIISYVTGSTFPYFLRSVAVTIMNFDHVWLCNLAKHNGIGGTIPLLNTDAHGYIPSKLKWQTDTLRTSSKRELLTWEDRNEMARLLKAPQKA